MKPPEAVRYSSLTFRLMLCMQTICCRSSVQNTWASPFSLLAPTLFGGERGRVFLPLHAVHRHSPCNDRSYIVLGYIVCVVMCFSFTL